MVLADLSNIILFVIYKIIYGVFYLGIVFCALFVKYSLKLKVFCVRLQAFCFRLFLRLEKTTVFKFFLMHVKRVFNFFYCFLRVTHGNKLGLKIITKFINFFHVLFIIIFSFRQFTILYTLVKFIFYLIIRKRFFFLLAWIFFFFGLYFTAIVCIEALHGIVLFYAKAIYHTFFYWPFYDFFYRANVTSMNDYLFYYKRAAFYRKATFGFWPV